MERARSKAKTPRHATPRLRPNRARFLRQWRKRSESREKNPKNYNQRVIVVVVVAVGCGCVVTLVSSGQLAVKWSLTDHATHRFLVCQKKTSSFELWRRLHPVALGVQTQKIGSFLQISIMTPCSPMGRVSYMQVWLGLACGLSFVRKLQQTSRLMMQTSSFSMLQNVADILWLGLVDCIYASTI